MASPSALGWPRGLSVAVNGGIIVVSPLVIALNALFSLLVCLCLNLKFLPFVLLTRLRRITEQSLPMRV